MGRYLWTTCSTRYYGLQQIREEQGSLLQQEKNHGWSRDWTQCNENCCRLVIVITWSPGCFVQATSLLLHTHTECFSCRVPWWTVNSFTELVNSLFTSAPFILLGLVGAGSHKQKNSTKTRLQFWCKNIVQKALLVSIFFVRKYGYNLSQKVRALSIGIKRKITHGRSTKTQFTLYREYMGCTPWTWLLEPNSIKFFVKIYIGRRQKKRTLSHRD